MSKDIAQLLADEAAAVEEAEEQGEQLRALSQVRVTRGHSRSRVLQVRLNEDELAMLEKFADARGLPISTVARSLLLGTMARGAVDVSAAMEAALRHVLRPEFLV